MIFMDEIERITKEKLDKIHMDLLYQRTNVANNNQRCESAIKINK